MTPERFPPLAPVIASAQNKARQAHRARLRRERFERFVRHSLIVLFAVGVGLFLSVLLVTAFEKVTYSQIHEIQQVEG